MRFTGFVCAKYNLRRREANGRVSSVRAVNAFESQLQWMRISTPSFCRLSM